ncbi:MAG TPA: ATP-binding protein [Methylococcaceae bacterium]|nr:ATP-binding protein [Methylococcaceae bacterium]
MTTPTLPLPPDALRERIDPAALPFASTAELEPLDAVLGQTRAMDALRFGVAMRREGCHVFVMGEPGTGRLSLSKNFLRAAASEQAAPDDWLYLANFSEPREPLALRLPAGCGRTLQNDLEALVEQLLNTVPAAFESPSHQQRKNAFNRAFGQRYNDTIDLVEKRAKSLDVALFRDGDSITFSPLHEGAPLDDAGFAQLPQDVRDAFHDHVRQLEDYLGEVLVELPQWKRDLGDELRQLNRDTLGQAVEPLLDPLESRYREWPDALAWLATLKEDLLRTLSEAAADEREEGARRAWLTDRYAPKLLVGHEPEGGAPVVHEPHPAYSNLFGRIDYISEQGVLVTHHRLIAAGALHRANGGYLLVEAEKLLAEPFVWPALKRVLQTGRIKIESPLAAEQGLALAMTLNPALIPCQVKVVIVGSRDLYYLLQEMDEEFDGLFRVLADFEAELPREEASLLHFARLVKHHAEQQGAQPLSAAAVALLAEHSARQAEHRHRLSARIGDSLQWVAEAERLRGLAGDAFIDAAHLRRAIAEHEWRTGRISQEILEDMLDGILLVATEGETVGQVNGLTVLEIGATRFGMPARITATVYPGSRGVVDIEREAELGESIHSKGVLILAGYLGNRYVRNFPLGISANLALEQSYGHIDGDSASLAELCALLSALTGIPLRQSFAVTGSINQHGEVQAVGGVNEKIEGFFRLCQARGLNGKQGVIVPRANCRNLMLKEEVVEAARQGQFAVYAVAGVDETLELLTGLSAGQADAKGRFPKHSINARVVERLRALYRASGEAPPPQRGGKEHKGE